MITFDAQGTLVDTRWSPARLGRDLIDLLSLPVDREAAPARLQASLGSRWVEYQAVNLLRSEIEGDAFWGRLLGDWLVEYGQPASRLDEVMDATRDILYGPDQDYFSLYHDVMPALDAIRSRATIGVISNWDYSLHRILRMLGVLDRFSFVIASLEEGSEKPDPRLFGIASGRAGVMPAEMLHVGDDPIDDLEGARNAGMAAMLVDRSRFDCVPPYIASLIAIPEVLRWTS